MPSGSRILLTGASTGIGAALAQLLHARGGQLVLVSRKTHTYDLPGAHWLSADLTIPSERDRVFAEASNLLGGVDVLINNAGVGAYTPTRKIPMADWQFMCELNLGAPVHLTRLALPAMLERNQGIIVNIASIASLTPLPWFTLYSTTKAALLSFTHGLRMELDGTSVRAIAVCPGYVKTPFQANALTGKPPKVLQQTKRFAITAEQCAAAIVRGMERGTRTVITPWSGHLLHWLYFLCPWLVDKQFARYNRNLQGSAN
jgi:short-subunit dehydrogenase